MQKKKFITVIAAILCLVVAIILIIVASHSGTKETTDSSGTTTAVAEESTTSLYGDVDPDEEDNVEILDKARTMRKKVTAQMESLKDSKFGKTTYTLKKAKLNKETAYQVYADGEATDVYFTFDKTGPSVSCTGTSDVDATTMRASATTILYVCTPSIGDLKACAKVFDSMKDSMEDKTTVTYNQNYTEYHYSVEDNVSTFSAMETEVVG